MSSRFGMRFGQQTTRSSFTSKAAFQIRNGFFRRWQTTAGVNMDAAAAPQSIFQRMWTSEVGVKTVHFWAPVMKWGVVLAGASDFLRPAEKLSLTQNLALMGTGSIWTRWCFVIRPKNMLLAAVNFCLFIVGAVQCSRIFMYQSSQKGSAEAGLKAMGKDIEGAAKSVEKKAESKL